MSADTQSESETGLTLDEAGEPEQGGDADEVVVAISPSFLNHVHTTILDVEHAQVLREVLAGIEEEGVKARIIRFRHTNDLAFIASRGARLSGSGISIGIQAKGTTMIHQRDLPPLSSMELYPQAPLITLEMYRAIGRNAALYAKGESPVPVPVGNDPMSRPRYQARAALLLNKEIQYVDADAQPVELTVSS